MIDVNTFILIMILFFVLFIFVFMFIPQIADAQELNSKSLTEEEYTKLEKIHEDIISTKDVVYGLKINTETNNMIQTLVVALLTGATAYFVKGKQQKNV